MAARPVQPARRRLAVREGWVVLPTGTRIRYRRVGEGEPVVLVHGLADACEPWPRVMIPLAHRYDVVALDLPGCGLSDKPETDYSLGSQATALRFFLDALGLRFVNLVGHSLGGGVAMSFAYQYPERVGRLALISSGGLGRELHPMFRLANLPFAGQLGMRVIFNRWLRPIRNYALRRFARSGHDPITARGGAYSQEVEHLLDALEEPNSQRAFSAMLSSASNVAGQAISALDRLPLARFPLLLVWGRDDAIFPVAHATRAAELVPGSKLVIIDDCGHMPQLEAAPVLIAALESWLTDTRPVRIRLKARTQPGSGTTQLELAAGS